MEELLDDFKWRRPKDMPMSLHAEFTREAAFRIGAGRQKLLQAVDDALNSDEVETDILDLDQAKAEEMLDSSGCHSKAGYYAHLAYRYEIAYRRTKGPGLFERHLGVVPCPDFLTCTAWQVPASRMKLYAFLNRLWNWGSVLTLPLLFPLIAVPVLVAFFPDSKVSRIFIVKVYPVICCLWALGVAMFASGFFACRAIRGKSIKPPMG